MAVSARSACVGGEGTRRGSRRARLRRGAGALQRDDRQATGRDRVLRRRGGRRRSPALRHRARPPDRHPRRRPQRGRSRLGRRRPRDRSLADERHHRRRCRVDGARRRRSAAQGSARGHASARSDRSRRHHRHHRRRRADARRRHGSSDPRPRPYDRQPRRGDRRARGRLDRPDRRRTGAGALLGAPWRRRQLRSGDVLLLPLSSPHDGPRRTGALRHRRCRGGARLVSRRSARAAGRRERLLRLPFDSAGPAVPGGAASAQGLRHRVDAGRRGGVRGAA